MDALKRIRELRDELTKRGHLFDSIPSAHRTRAERMEDVSRKVRDTEIDFSFVEISQCIDNFETVRKFKFLKCL